MAKKDDKSAGQKLEEKLLIKSEAIGEKKNGLLEEAQAYGEEYKRFLEHKTEREIVDYTIPIVKKLGYKEFVYGTKYKPGDKVYFNNRNKNLITMTFGKKPLTEGVRISVAHADSPRLDFKPNPLFEATDMAFFKTHYYGGIKKYQWTTIPLSIHGVVTLTDGKTVKVTIGEDDDDPAFCITDLLIHLAYDQVQKPAAKVIDGEQLNILIGSWPLDDDKVQSKVKLNIMKILNEKYGITEADFQSAELCACPAYKPKDLGLDRSMISAYGQDDKVCCFAQFKAETETKNPEYTSMMVFADKEETGSDGPTGMRSVFWKDFLEDVGAAWGYSVRHILRKSLCLSCDVNAAVDPGWPEVFEARNCSYLGRGPVVSKYTGSRGKYSTNDASAETMGYLRSILEEAEVPWQVGELGKVDVGGGGTIASEISIHNIDTIDMGVPVLSMHAPMEVTSKVDDYRLYKAMKALFASKKAKDF